MRRAEPTATGAELLVRVAAAAKRDVADVASLAIAISHIPYGRPPDLTAQGVVASWRGTCSTKHLLLRELVPVCDPAAALNLVHRVYRVTPETAAAAWGSAVAAHVPSAGLVDVHTYGVLHRGTERVVVDVTFPIGQWDGQSPLPLACGDGEDFPAGDDPLKSKQVLTSRWCDSAVREPFIAALAAQHGRGS